MECSLYGIPSASYIEASRQARQAAAATAPPPRLELKPGYEHIANPTALRNALAVQIHYYQPLPTSLPAAPRTKALSFAQRCPPDPLNVRITRFADEDRFTGDPKYRKRLVKGAMLQCYGELLGVVELEERMFDKEGYTFVRAADHMRRRTYTLGFAEGQVQLPTPLEELLSMEAAYQRKQTGTPGMLPQLQKRSWHDT